MKKPTSRRVQAAAVAALAVTSGLAVSVLTTSSAGAAGGMAGPYPIATEPASGLADGQLITMSVSAAPAAAPLASIEIHVCNSGTVNNQFDFSYDAGVCSPAPLGVFSNNVGPFAPYPVPAGEARTDFTYTAVAGTTEDGLVTCGVGAANCYLVYRLTNSEQGEYFFGQQLTYGPGMPTTTTTVPETTSTTAATTSTTVPETTSTTVPATTTTTVPETTSTTVPATTTTTVPETTSTTVPATTTTTVPETTSTTVPSTTTTVSSTSTTLETTTTTVPATTTTTVAGTTTTTVPGTTTTTAPSTTTTTVPSTTTTVRQPPHPWARLFLLLKCLIRILFHLAW
jgi:hypothetical protein